MVLPGIDIQVARTGIPGEDIGDGEERGHLRVGMGGTRKINAIRGSDGNEGQKIVGACAGQRWLPFLASISTCLLWPGRGQPVNRDPLKHILERQTKFSNK